MMRTLPTLIRLGLNVTSRLARIEVLGYLGFVKTLMRACTVMSGTPGCFAARCACAASAGATVSPSATATSAVAVPRWLLAPRRIWLQTGPVDARFDIRTLALNIASGESDGEALRLVGARRGGEIAARLRKLAGASGDREREDLRVEAEGPGRHDRAVRQPVPRRAESIPCEHVQTGVGGRADLRLERRIGVDGELEQRLV